MRARTLTIRNRPDTLMDTMSSVNPGEWVKKSANTYCNKRLQAHVFICRNEDFKREYHLHTRYKKEVHHDHEALEKALRWLSATYNVQE